MIFLAALIFTLTQASFAVQEQEILDMSWNKKIIGENLYELGLQRQFPLLQSADRFSPDQHGIMVGYKRNLGGLWLASISLSNRRFSRRELDTDDTRTLHVLALGQKIQHMVRLENWLFMLIGPALEYILPAKSGKLPPVRSDAFSTEVAAGLALGAVTPLSSRWHLAVDSEIWRGTKTTKLQALQLSFSLVYSAP